MTTSPTLPLDAAAAHIGLSVAQFRREVHEGRAPPPLPLKCRPRRWSRAVLDQWIATNGAADTSAPSARDRLLGRIDAMT